jgi:hypothetical protein
VSGLFNVPEDPLGLPTPEESRECWLRALRGMTAETALRQMRAWDDHYCKSPRENHPVLVNARDFAALQELEKDLKK